MQVHPSSSSIFLPSGFSLSTFISCVAMALLRTASRVRGGEKEMKKKMKGTINTGAYSTSSRPSPSLWDVTFHLLRYRRGGGGDSIHLLTSGRAAAADQTFKKQWRAGWRDSSKECWRCWRVWGTNSCTDQGQNPPTSVLYLWTGAGKTCGKQISDIQ